MRRLGLVSATLLLAAVAVYWAVRPQSVLSRVSDAGTAYGELPTALHWQEDQLLVCLIRDEHWTPEREQRAREGFRQWQPVTGASGVPQLGFTSSDRPLGKINVRFLPDGGLGNSSVGRTIWANDGKKISSAVLYLTYASREGRRERARQVSTAAHELGNALGITEHSHDREDLMYRSSAGKSVGEADFERLMLGYR